MIKLHLFLFLSTKNKINKTVASVYLLDAITRIYNGFEATPNKLETFLIRFLEIIFGHSKNV